MAHILSLLPILTFTYTLTHTHTQVTQQRTGEEDALEQQRQAEQVCMILLHFFNVCVY
jgi:DNA-binding transcriptional regulator LsrR (DeoR family)